MAFNIGDNVQLRAGGPQMTISNLDTNGYVYCEWFDAHNDRHTDRFRDDLLQATETDDADPASAPSL
ncbi:MAG: DUF2158 domain-containing protein [Asticcacaulis sp.]